jgi:peptidoglycan/LPS O-acetylase OafA/YrhL
LIAEVGKPGMAFRCYPNDTLREITLSLLLLPQQGSHCFIPQAWSLNFEIYFYSIFSVVFFLVRSRVIPALTVWAMLSLLVISGATGWFATFSAINLHFLLGCLVALVWSGSGERFAGTAVVLGIIWFAGSAWLNAIGAMSTEDVNHRLVQFGIGSAFLLYGVLAAESKWRVPRWAVLIGDASYSIYLVHLTTFIIFRRLTEGLAQGPLMHTLWLCAIVAAGIVPGVLLHLFVEKPMLRVFARRIAQRSDPHPLTS